MKKKKLISLASIAVSVMLATAGVPTIVAFADGGSTNTYTSSSNALAQFESQLVAAGVPQQFIPSIVAQVISHPISQSDIDTLVAKMKDLSAQIGERTSIDQFTTSELKNFYTEARTMACSYGLTLTISSDLNSIVVSNTNNKAVITSNISDINSNDSTTPEVSIVLSDAKTGTVISSMNLVELKTLIKGIDVEKLKTALKYEMAYADAIAAEKNASNTPSDTNNNTNGNTNDNTNNNNTNGNTNDNTNNSNTNNNTNDSTNNNTNTNTTVNLSDTTIAKPVDVQAIKTSTQEIAVSDTLSVVLPQGFLSSDKLENVSDLKLAYDKVSVSDANQNLLSKNGYKPLGKVYDFNLVASYKDGSQGLIRKFDNPISLNISLTDDELRGIDKSRLKVLYLNEVDGTVEVMPTNVNGNKVTFSTTHFSKYLIAEVQNTGAQTASSTPVTKTSDSNNVVGLATLAMASIVITTTSVLAYNKRRNRANN